MVRLLTALLFLCPLVLFGAGAAPASDFPRALTDYQDPAGAGLWEVLTHRAQVQPFNLIALAIFLCAIIHTFLTAKLRHWAHEVEQRHDAKIAERKARGEIGEDEPREESFRAHMLHFLGEVEAVFGIWVLALAGALTWYKGWGTVNAYIATGVNYTEPLFVVVIMAIAATHPILSLAERFLRSLANVGGGTPAAWWVVVLVVAPLLGSFITEPAAMTIAALILGRQFYRLKPSPKLAYATIGLLFVNISVGGTLTHFAAPPVLMVAATWKWDLAFMFANFGWKAAVGIVLATGVYFLAFRKELKELGSRATDDAATSNRRRVPAWITLVQVGFLAFTVWQAHYPVMFIGGFLFFLAFVQATGHHQTQIDLKPPILVGFFLAGLVIHGGLQGWWIEPILTRLGEFPLFLTATVLTAFNDNAAITYLASLVPGFSDTLKYAVVAGAVTGGGLTVIANAPNPAGQNILARYFPQGVAPAKLFLSALVPTVIVGACFILL